jgi:predicted DsbA family dithiol-disulfide isomerase
MSAWLACTLTGIVLLISIPTSNAATRAPVPTLTAKDSAFVKSTINSTLCPCGCGNYLPGSRSKPTCFGCSVGKAEIARLEEGLAAGDSRVALLMQTKESIIIDVFADYSDSDLSTTWNRAQRVAKETGQHRVVLRTPGRTEVARRAVAAVECARLQGRFSEMQKALIEHEGPWDVSALADIAQRLGLHRQTIQTCMMTADIHPQILKDREHSGNRSIQRYPTITINREIVINQDGALKRAVQRLLSQGSL